MGLESLRGLRPASFCLVRKNQSQELGYQLNPFGQWKILKSSGLKRACSSSSFNEFFPSKVEFFEPESLGIKPEPPEWLERDKIAMISIERKANRVEIPLSLRMIKRKQLQKYCPEEGSSAKKALSYMMFMIRELQSHAFQLRESLYSEDLQLVRSKVQVEINSSFVWLFQKVFSKTPTLMVYVILLLASFSVYSMAGHSQSDTKMIPLPASYQETILDESITPKNPGFVDVVAIPTEDEIVVWESIVEAASRMSTFEVLDPETLSRIVSSVEVELEPDKYEDYFRTDLAYQMAVAEDPWNPLLLTNYAQFLYLVPRDHDRAEECFKRAILVEPHDADWLTRYADFLWLVRKDIWGAEERYQQALAAEPNSHYHASKYAAFLWNNGGDETCFPLSSPSNDNYDKVM